MFTKTLALVLLPLVLAISIDDILPRGEANCPGLNSSVIVSDAEVPSGFCPFIFATGLGAPRGILVVENGDVLLVEQDYARVTVLYDEDRDGQSSEWERAILAEATGLNHGLAVNGGYLYASSATQVFRWSYTPGDRQTLKNRTLVVDDIPCCHHVTRTLVFDTNGTLYVQSGSGSNVDPDPTHSEIRTFNVLGDIPDGGIQWSQGVLYASGLRNEVGLRFDDTSRLWGVENGCDDLNRPDLGGDIHDNNPSEEMNLFFGPGLFYGYPYCWSEFDLPLNHSHPIGTQWVHPNFMNSSVFSDDWCQNPSNVIPPAYNFQAHMAPMDIIFDIPSSFSLPYGAFVSFHGSWDRPVPVGYRVDYVLFDQEGLFPQANKPIFQHAGDTASWEYRPVGLAWTQNCFFGDCLLITDDQSGTVLALANPGN